jgi:archaeal type IV pilus assembly protein PilA
MNKINRCEAVSPVVGVMLMLVVVIIIAAVVSAFAGGLSQETSKAPQATIHGTYSVSQGIFIEHTGGDPIGTPSVKILVQPAESFGTSTHAIDTINLSTVTDSTGTLWLKANGGVGVKSFRGGDVAIIRPPDHLGPTLQPSAANTGWFNNTDNVGKTFWIKMVDPRGKMIAKTEVTIEP